MSLPTVYISYVPSVNVGWLLLPKFSFSINYIFLLEAIIKLLYIAVCFFCILFLQFLYTKCTKSMEVVSPHQCGTQQKTGNVCAKIGIFFFPTCFSCDSIQENNRNRNLIKLAPLFLFATLCNSI